MFGDMAKKTRALVGSKPFTLSSDLTGLATMLSAFAGTWEDGKKRSQQKIKTLMKPQVAAIEEIMDAESLGAIYLLVSPNAAFRGPNGPRHTVPIRKLVFPRSA